MVVLLNHAIHAYRYPAPADAGKIFICFPRHNFAKNGPSAGYAAPSGLGPRTRSPD
jgi:hypothetical protein